MHIIRLKQVAFKVATENSKLHRLPIHYQIWSNIPVADDVYFVPEHFYC